MRDKDIKENSLRINIKRISRNQGKQLKIQDQRTRRTHILKKNQGNLLKNQDQENQKNPQIKKSGETVKESGSGELEEPLNMCRARTWRTKRKI